MCIARRGMGELSPGWFCLSRGMRLAPLREITRQRPRSYWSCLDPTRETRSLHADILTIYMCALLYTVLLPKVRICRQMYPNFLPSRLISRSIVSCISMIHFPIFVQNEPLLFYHPQDLARRTLEGNLRRFYWGFHLPRNSKCFRRCLHSATCSTRLNHRRRISFIHPQVPYLHGNQFDADTERPKCWIKILNVIDLSHRGSCIPSIKIVNACRAALSSNASEIIPFAHLTLGSPLTGLAKTTPRYIIYSTDQLDRVFVLNLKFMAH